MVAAFFELGTFSFVTHRTAPVQHSAIRCMRTMHVCFVILDTFSCVCRVVTEGQAIPLEEIAARFEDNTIAFLKHLSAVHLQSRYTWGGRISHLLLHLDFLGRRDLDVSLT